MLRKPLPYLRFRRKATNRHGVHSPFIYKILEDVVYKKRQKNSAVKSRKKEFHLYLRLFDYFQTQNIYLHENDDFFEKLLFEYQNTNPQIKVKQSLAEFSSKAPFDLYILNNIQNHLILDKFDKSLSIKNNSFVIIPQIRASKQQLEFWEEFAKKEYAIISLEFYHFGLVFFRKECSRQYFSIKF